MTDQTGSAAMPSERRDDPTPIVVAVDGSPRNRGAVAWAAAEAAITGAAMVLLTAMDNHLVPVPHFSVSHQDQRALKMLDILREKIRPLVGDADVQTEAVAGSAVQVIVDHSEQARMVVVGKRGLGGFGRLLVGSTSIAVAGRAQAPVVIVPQSWEQADHAKAPIVLGVDPYRAEHPSLRFAFERARRDGVRLDAVHGWETPTVYSWDEAALSSTMSQWEQEAAAEFDRVIDSWRARFPEVEVVATHSHAHPAMAVLDTAEDAQLVVLGRHARGRHLGFPFGSVTRAVLHYSDCPVVVIPGDGD